MTPYEQAGYGPLTVFVTKNWGEKCAHGNGTIVHIDTDDGTTQPYFKTAGGDRYCYVLGKYVEELPKDSDGYYIWEGGECPVPGDWVVSVQVDGFGAGKGLASNYSWKKGNDLADITAFKPISRPDMPSAVEAPEKPTRSAPEFLKQAADLMTERGKEYDKPSGERSMGNSISAFNAVTGRDLSEAEGWLLMSLVKRVRQYSTPSYHKDSAEDAVAYAALEAEALERE